MRKLFGKYADFFGNVTVLMSGKALAALIALFTMPIVARLFSPEHFGVAAMFVSITSVLSAVGTLNYSSASLLPKDPLESATIIAFSYRILLVICLALFTLIGIADASSSTIPALESLGIWKWFLPIGVLLSSAVRVQENWLTRQKAFGTASTALVIFNTATTGSRIGFGALFGTSVHGLVTGYFIGLVARLSIQQSVGREVLKVTFSHIGIPKFREIARRYADFPKFSAPAGLMFAMGQNLPVVLFGVLFSPVIAGLYAMAHRLSQVPVAIVAQSTRQVFLQKATTVSDCKEELRQSFLLATGVLAAIGFIPFTVLWLYGQPSLAWLLGDRWVEAGGYLETMAVWLFMLWVSAPSHPIFIVLRKQSYWLTLQSVFTLLKLGVFGVAFKLGSNPESTLLIFATVSALGNVISIFTALFLIARYDSRPSAYA